MNPHRQDFLNRVMASLGVIAILDDMSKDEFELSLKEIEHQVRRVRENLRVQHVIDDEGVDDDEL